MCQILYKVFGLEFKLRKSYSRGRTSIQSQLALHFATICNVNCDWMDVPGEYFVLSLNSSSDEILEVHISPYDHSLLISRPPSNWSKRSAFQNRISVQAATPIGCQLSGDKSQPSPLLLSRKG